MADKAPAMRVCDACGQVDDHPRHVLDAGDSAPDVTDKLLDHGYDPDVVKLAIRQLAEPGVYLHMDCCRERGCPDATCDRQTAGAEDLRGDELHQHLMSLGGK